MNNLTTETSNDIRNELGNFEHHGSRIVMLEEQTNDQKTMIDAHAIKIDDLVVKDAEHTKNIENLQSIYSQIVRQDSNHTGKFKLFETNLML